MQNMPDVLAEHQSIMLGNFEAIYISTNGTVSFMSQSFIARHIVPFYAKRPVAMGFIFNTFYTTSETFMSLNICPLQMCKVHMSCFCIEIYMLRRHTQNGHN